MTQYLEAVRRRTWRRCGKIKARAREGGIQRQRKAGLEKENARTMRRNTVLGPRQHLAYRTQRGIVWPAAWARGCLNERRSTFWAFGKSVEGTRHGQRYRFYGHFPAMGNDKGELSNEGEQTP